MAPIIVGLVLLIVGGFATDGCATQRERFFPSPTTSSTTTTTTTSPPIVVDPASEQTALDECSTSIEGEGEGEQWVQVESSPAKPDEWLVPEHVEDGLLELCDGSGLVASSTASRIMAVPALTGAEAGQLDAEVPPEKLRDVCELRRRLRIAGGARPYRADGMATYFSNFVLVPSKGLIGPTRCWPLLAADPEFGSRAAVDRYVNIVSQASRGDLTNDEAVPLFAEVTTEDFLEESGGVAGIVAEWERCDGVEVEWMGTPAPIRDVQSVEVRPICRTGPTAEERLAVTLAMQRDSVTGMWKVQSAREE